MRDGTDGESSGRIFVTRDAKRALRTEKFSALVGEIIPIGYIKLLNMLKKIIRIEIIGMGRKHVTYLGIQRVTLSNQESK